MSLIPSHAAHSWPLRALPDQASDIVSARDVSWTTEAFQAKWRYALYRDIVQPNVLRVVVADPNDCQRNTRRVCWEALRACHLLVPGTWRLEGPARHQTQRARFGRAGRRATVLRLTDRSLSGRRRSRALANPDASRGYAAVESVGEGGARTRRAGREGLGRDARSASRTALAAMTVGPSSRSPLRATTAVEAVTGATTSSISAPSYRRPHRRRSGGLASARGKMANRRTRRPRAHKLLHRPPTWLGKAWNAVPGIVRATNDAPSAKGTGECKTKEIAATVRGRTVGVNTILSLLGR